MENTKRRKLLVASLGVATLSYVMVEAGCRPNPPVSGTLPAPPETTPISGNLPAPPPPDVVQQRPPEPTPISGNLPAPPPQVQQPPEPPPISGNLPAPPPDPPRRRRR
ncbi:MAG: hypothetical protein HY909_28090 [Deltaproteobacteria bacterium]|nr:hypothetical protein [Deltaproteobacteria bacterium]